MINTSKPNFLFLIVLFLISCSTEDTPEPERESDVPNTLLSTFENLNGGEFATSAEVWFWATDANNTILDYEKMAGEAVSLQRPESFRGERVNIHVLTINLDGTFHMKTYHQIKPKQFIYKTVPQSTGQVNYSFDLTGVPVNNSPVVVLCTGGEKQYSVGSIFRTSLSHTSYALTDNVFYAYWLKDGEAHYKLVDNLLSNSAYSIDLSQSSTTDMRPLHFSLGNQPHQINDIHIDSDFTTASGNKRLIRTYWNSFFDRVSPLRTATAHLPESLTKEYNLSVRAIDENRSNYFWQNLYRNAYPETLEMLEVQFDTENANPVQSTIHTIGSHDFLTIEYKTTFFDWTSGHKHYSWMIYGNKSFSQAFPALPAEVSANYSELNPDFFQQSNSQLLVTAEEWDHLDGFDEYMSVNDIYYATAFTPLLTLTNQSIRRVIVRPW